MLKTATKPRALSVSSLSEWCLVDPQSNLTCNIGTSTTYDFVQFIDQMIETIYQLERTREKARALLFDGLYCSDIDDEVRFDLVKSLSAGKGVRELRRTGVNIVQEVTA